MQIHSGPHNTSTFKNGLWWRILVAIIVIGGLGVLSSRLCMGEHQVWYHALNQPFFMPPTWLPWMMWTIVYILIGGSIGIIWQLSVVGRYPIIIKLAKRGLIIFFIHFIFVFIYPTLLFGFHQMVLALIDLCIILIFVVGLIRFFFRLDRVAAFLLVPYFIWASYAAALNIALIILN